MRREAELKNRDRNEKRVGEAACLKLESELDEEPEESLDELWAGDWRIVRTFDLNDRPVCWSERRGEKGLEAGVESDDESSVALCDLGDLKVDEAIGEKVSGS